MSVSSVSRRRRVLNLGCGMAWFALSATCAMAGPANPAGSAEMVAASEPFGGLTLALHDGALNDKWRAVGREIDDEMVVIALCQENRAHCTSAAALQFLAIVEKASVLDGRARIGEINRAINLSVRPVSDLVLYGEVDVWSSPLNTLARGAGDCEDYAIAKLAALRAAGVEASNLRLTIWHDARRAQDHAAVAVRLDGEWIVLDNQRLQMLKDTDIRNAQPIVSIGGGGVRLYSAS
jgi:predicted transglutaminase-like cysteine proteinase